MDLDEIRAGIDAIDEEVVRLLAERAKLVGKAAELKKSRQGVRDPRRVEQVINRVRMHAERAGFFPDTAEKIYRTVIECFVESELADFEKVKDKA